MWKIVVLGQLSVPEMMGETSFGAIDTMSGFKPAFYSVPHVLFTTGF